MAYRLVTGSIVDFVDAAWADIHTEIIARREKDRPSVIAISRHSAAELIVALPQEVIVWHKADRIGFGDAERVLRIR